MALNSAEVLVAIGDRIRSQVATFKRVYSQGEGPDEDDRLPLGVGLEMPCALVTRGASMEEPRRQQGLLRHVYAVEIRICVAGQDLGQNAYQSLVLADAVMNAFVGAVKLGMDRVTVAQMPMTGGWTLIEWAKQLYDGEVLTMIIQEEDASTVTPAP